MAQIEKLRGKWALVTGASSGIGLEFCRRLAVAGCNIVAVSNQPDELTAVCRDLRMSHGIDAREIMLDLSSSDAAAVVTSRLTVWRIIPSLLINNAGIFDFKAVDDMDERRVNLYIDLHVRVVTHLTRTVGAKMAENGGGYILNMSSMSCWMPMPGITMYAATKSYIRCFSRAYRIEMKDKGVSVTVACPGGIATGLFGLPENLRRLGVRLGVLATPQSFVRNVLEKTLRGKAQYINGFVNRLSIVAVASLPEWARTLIKTRLLDRIGNK